MLWVEQLIEFIFLTFQKSGTDRTVFSNLRTGDVSLGTVTGNPWTLVSHSYEDGGDPSSGGGQLKGFLNTALTSTINDEDAEPITDTDELTLGDPLGTVDPFLQGFCRIYSRSCITVLYSYRIRTKKIRGMALPYVWFKQFITLRSFI